jgi:beta-glucosidase
MDALREGAGALMCSYQRINDSYGCQNSKLLNGVLKTELGFEGFVVREDTAVSQHAYLPDLGLGLGRTTRRSCISQCRSRCCYASS